jgi:hypothetical protein
MKSSLSEIWQSIAWFKYTDVSEEHTASIVRVEEYAKKASAYSSTVKIGAVRSSETMESLYQTTRRNVSEDRALQHVNKIQSSRLPN